MGSVKYNILSECIFRMIVPVMSGNYVTGWVLISNAVQGFQDTIFVAAMEGELLRWPIVDELLIELPPLGAYRCHDWTFGTMRRLTPRCGSSASATRRGSTRPRPLGTESCPIRTPQPPAGCDCPILDAAVADCKISRGVSKCALDLRLRRRRNDRANMPSGFHQPRYL